MYKVFHKELLVLFVEILFISIILQFLNFTSIFSYSYSDFLSYHILWQWITPSLVHYNWIHWFLNIANLFIMIFLFQDAWNSKKFVFLFSLFSFFIMLSLYMYSPDVKYYVGMSGVLYGIVLYGALKTVLSQKFISSVVLLYVMMKLFADKIVNHYMGVDVLLGDMIVIEDVHWYGAISGLIYFVCEMIYINYKKLYTPMKG